MNVVWDLGTIIVLIFILLLILCTISFFFIKINDIFGLKIHQSVLNEVTWHKVHVIAGICNIPFIIVLGLLMFNENVIVKLMLSMVMIMLVIISWSIVPSVVTKKERNKKYKLEREIQKQEREKENGWIR